MQLAVEGEDSITLIFEVEDNAVDAYVLANSLIAFADLALAVDHRINPGTEVGIEVFGLERGSLRAKVRRVEKGAPGFFADGAKSVFWGVISSLIVMWLFQSPHLTVHVHGKDVTVTDGDETVVIDIDEGDPQDAKSAVEAASGDPAVQTARRNLFRTLEADGSIRSFGVERPGHVPITVPQSAFARLSSEAIPEEVPSRRRRTERAILVILKPSLHRKPRKWAFEWNGVPLSARITDQAFLETMRRRGFLIGYGDALEVDLCYEQDFDEALGVYKNDTTTFEVTKVLRHLPSG